MYERIFTANKKPEAKRHNLVPQIRRKTEISQSMDSPVDRIQFLQRTIGNQAVGKLIKSGALQAKLRIGQPGDIYEQEADRVAEQVMRMPDVSEAKDTRIQRKCPQCPNGLHKLLDREKTETNINTLKGGGHPLPESTRAFFEPRFGVDFSQVQVHSDTAAEQSARDVNANAYTMGNNIVFGASQFAPGTHEGQRLIAHELTHVVQQSHTGPALQPKLKITGKEGDVSRAIKLLNAGLGNFYYVSVDKSGEVKIEPIRPAHTSSKTGPNAQEKALADRLWTVTNDPKDVIMTVSAGSKTLVGSWVTADFDIADIEKVGVGALIHEIVEQHQKQAKGEKKFGTATTGAHGEASKAESEVTGLKRGADKVISMTQNADGTIDAVIETTYTAPDGKVKTMVSTIKSNNIVSITWK